MSINREFEVFLTETACCFRCCLSVVSAVMVVGFDSFGRVWHLSCVLFWLVSVLLMYVGNSISKLQMQVTNYVFELSAGNCHR
jgi:hypothetical protein